MNELWISSVLPLINPISLASEDDIVDDDSSLNECLYRIGTTKPELLRILSSLQGLHPMSYLQWRGWSCVLFLNHQTIPPSATTDALPNPIVWIRLVGKMASSNLGYSGEDAKKWFRIG